MASDDKTLKVWDVEGERELRTLAGHSDFVSSVALTTDEKSAVSTSWDRTLKVWDLESGQELQTLEGHSGPVYCVVLTGDGRAVSASSDHTLKVWDLENGMCIASFYADASIRCCAVARHRIVAGDAGGRVYFLMLEE